MCSRCWTLLCLPNQTNLSCTSAHANRHSLRLVVMVVPILSNFESACNHLRLAPMVLLSASSTLSLCNVYVLIVGLDVSQVLEFSIRMHRMDCYPSIIWTHPALPYLWPCAACLDAATAASAQHIPFPPCSLHLMMFPNCSCGGAFTIQDMHSLMLMVCSDIPLRVTRSAFKAASPLLPSGGSPLLQNTQL